MKLFMVLVASFAFAVALPSKKREETAENELTGDLQEAAQPMIYAVAFPEIRASCVIGWKQQGAKCERDCECCGVAATCITRSTNSLPGFCGYRQTPNVLGQGLLYTADTISNGLSAIFCAA
uniref:U15-barytoxin-Tl1b n=1 Tax=Trittame loki TaxID=1295018 RepID=TX33B_TRILK|nr:RecName: Full=Toxin ICK-23; Flags: Precursor [Trittame loki]